MVGIRELSPHNTKNFVVVTSPPLQFLKKDAVRKWFPDHHMAFNDIKIRLTWPQSLPWRTNSGVSRLRDATDFVIGRTLMQHDEDDRWRVTSY